MRPVFHLSLPVRDLDEAVGFYTGMLGGVTGRREASFADVALFGAQVTLQAAPEDVLSPNPRTRHFGATVGWEAWQVLAARLDTFVEPPTVTYAGERREQAKLMLADSSGNLIELKAYRDPVHVLGDIAG